ncbi:response regulator [Seminibacterium arietis]|uniref:Response regulator n=1 Tax=Seminibacterium arietis TaxID=1173502 RepID=A0ABW3I8K1_9PAST
MAKLLLVDDDIELVELLVELLTLEGYEVDVANNGQQALEKHKNYDLILLDIMLPVLNGFETLKQIRAKYNTPVMMLTARRNEIDRVLGLELGADDYLSKPFNDRELVARIKAILRRTGCNRNSTELPHQWEDVEHATLKFCGLTLYPGRQQAIFNEQDLKLTGTEFALLRVLICHPGQVLSREYLSLNGLGKVLSPFDRTIDMHMSNLRKKLPPRSDNTSWFKTLRCKGYLLVAEK